MYPFSKLNVPFYKLTFSKVFSRIVWNNVLLKRAYDKNYIYYNPFTSDLTHSLHKTLSFPEINPSHISSGVNLFFLIYAITYNKSSIREWLDSHIPKVTANS